MAMSRSGKPIGWVNLPEWVQGQKTHHWPVPEAEK
jgi:hypothetical protein